MFRRIAPLLLVLLLPLPATAEEARWPLDLPNRYLTSNFMEYRPGRFHAGLDLKTQTVSGFAAYAVEDGWIVRVRASARAYGRAVYLRGASGRTYVYAHLERFNDDLRGRLDAVRARTGRYRVHLEYDRGAVPVKRGDVLGLTGQSGTGGPHLHFEVRDAGNRPIDPQAAGFAVDDRIAPKIATVRAWPVTPGARLAGGDVPRVLADRRGLTGELPALAVEGPVALSARIIEVSDAAGHRLEPAVIELEIDGQTVFASRNRRYGFDQNALQRLEWVELPGVRERWLHRHPANTLDGREGGQWHLGADGTGLEPGTHRVVLRAADRAGNVSEVAFDLVVGEGSSAGAGTWAPAIAGAVMADADSSAVLTAGPFFARGVEDAAAIAGLERHRFTPAAGDPVVSAMTVYGRPAAPDSAQLAAATAQGLRYLGSAREFRAGAWPIEADLSLPMPAGSSGERPEAAALHRWDGREWDRVGPWPVGTASPLTVRIARSGVYAAFVDEAPPRIGLPDGALSVGPAPEAPQVPGVTRARWAVLPVRVADAGSGLDPASVQVQFDGRPLVVEPDLPRSRLLVEFPDTTEPGSHLLAVEIADRAGNKATADIPVEIRD